MIGDLERRVIDPEGWGFTTALEDADRRLVYGVRSVLMYGPGRHRASRLPRERSSVIQAPLRRESSLVALELLRRDPPCTMSVSKLA